MQRSYLAPNVAIASLCIGTAIICRSAATSTFSFSFCQPTEFLQASTPIKLIFLSPLPMSPSHSLRSPISCPTILATSLLFPFCSLMQGSHASFQDLYGHRGGAEFESLNDLRCHSVHWSSSRDVALEKVRHTCICLCLRVPMRWAMTLWASVHIYERRLLGSTMDVLSLCRGALWAVRSMLPHTATQITITKYTFSSLSDS